MRAEFSLDTLLTTLRRIGCDQPHPVFAGGLRYVPPSATAQIDRAAFEELSEFGLTQGDGFTTEFEEILRLIDNPSTELFAYARDTDEQIGVLVAARGRSAVTVLVQGERVWLRSLSPDTSPVDALVANLPPCAPARIKPFSVAQDDFRREDVDDLYADTPSRPREARLLDDLLRQPHRGIGQLYARRPGQGSELSYVDVEAGRVAIALSAGFINVVPGDPVALGRKLLP